MSTRIASRPSRRPASLSGIRAPPSRQPVFEHHAGDVRQRARRAGSAALPAPKPVRSAPTLKRGRRNWSIPGWRSGVTKSWTASHGFRTRARRPCVTPSTSPSAPKPRATVCCRSCREQWDPNGERCAALIVVAVNSSSMASSDTTTDGQSEAGSALLGTDEGLKDSFHHRGRYARSVI